MVIASTSISRETRDIEKIKNFESTQKKEDSNSHVVEPEDNEVSGSDHTRPREQ